MSKKICLLFFIAFCIIRASLGATQIQGGITLVNDSPFILTATVYTSSGDYLGQVILQPGEQKNYTTNLSSTNLSRPGFPNVSITPYRIVWTCAGGGFYSMCTDGAVGSVIQASLCPGQHYCTPKEEQQKPPAAVSGQQKK